MFILKKAGRSRLVMTRLCFPPYSSLRTLNICVSHFVVLVFVRVLAYFHVVVTSPFSVFCVFVFVFIKELLILSFSFIFVSVFVNVTVNHTCELPLSASEAKRRQTETVLAVVASSSSHDTQPIHVVK